ncbi:DUF3017 domain-containing protein [Streptomyces griseus]|uniref:DUF3017 domain-containing protein n=1 Tax=Streptomyces griseus TaxID=1911 RepID=UPI00083FFFF0|nr:DUF3017 domain-containing protein [Streptomyces griseus]
MGAGTSPADGTHAAGAAEAAGGTGDAGTGVGTGTSVGTGTAAAVGDDGTAREEGADHGTAGLGGRTAVRRDALGHEGETTVPGGTPGPAAGAAGRAGEAEPGATAGSGKAAGSGAPAATAGSAEPAGTADSGEGEGDGPAPARSRRFSLTRDTARPEGGGRAASGDAPAPARQWPLLAVLCTAGIGLLLVGTDPFAEGFRIGTMLIGIALLGGAVLRWVVPSVGMLAVRSRFTDLVTYGLMGSLIVLLALMAQPKPWLDVPFLQDVVHFTIR